MKGRSFVILHYDQILEKGYMQEANRMLCGDGVLVETQLGCQRHKLGSDSALT